MSLTVNIPDTNPTTGVSSSLVNPITAGTTMTVVSEQTGFGGFLGALDELGGDLIASVSKGVKAYADSEIKSLVNGAESSITSIGDESDQPGSTSVSTTAAFIDEYKTPLIIGGSVLFGILAIYLVKK